MQILALDLGVDQLKLQGTYLSGDFGGKLADKIFADAVVDGEPLHVERSVGDIFKGVSAP